MPDYSKSKIYKLYDNTNGDTYYGSTCNELRYRIYQHKDATNNTKSKSIILNDDYSYSVVEEFPCETKLELHTRERWWIENNKCVNKCVPTRTHKEWKNDNKEEVNLYSKEYRANNIEKSKEYNKNYMKKYNIINKEEIKKKRETKILCECGTEIRTDNLKKHKTTAKHIKLMSCLPCVPSPPSPP